MTLYALAQICDCSIALLSKIEKGKAHPSLNTLHRIALALDPTSGISCQRTGTSPRPSSGGASGRSCPTACCGAGTASSWRPCRSLPPAAPYQVNIHHVDAGGRSDGCITHPGEEFIYVPAGEIDLILDGEITRMAAGDSAFFASHIPHGYANPGSVRASVLWLNSPPTF